MCKRMFVLSILCVFVLAVASAAQEKMRVENDLQKQFDRNHDGFLDQEERVLLGEFSEARERIEKLCAMAREAEEKARHLWAEAEELERTLNRRFGPRRIQEPMEKMHARLAELKEAAKHAERQGRHDEAAELHDKARKIAEEIDAHARGARKRQFQEAEEIERARKRELEHREMAEHTDKMHARLAELHEAAEHAKRQGRHDKAEALLREAEELEHHLRAADDRQRQRPPENQLAHELEKLRDEVHGLRREMEELREVVHEKVMQP